MDKGFTIDVDEADKAAKYPGGSMAHAAELLRAPVSRLVVFSDGFGGGGWFDAADRMQAAYPVWTQAIGLRLERGCEVLDANAAALRDIIALYRRVDGRKQG